MNGIYAFLTDGFVDSYDDLKLYHNAAGMGYYVVKNEMFKNYMIKEGDINYVDVNGDGVIDGNDQVYMGSTLPEISGGIVNELRWKNFDLNMLLSYSIGRHAVNTLVSGSVEGRVLHLCFLIRTRLLSGKNREIKLIMRRLVENDGDWWIIMSRK